VRDFLEFGVQDLVRRLSWSRRDSRAMPVDLPQGDVATRFSAGDHANDGLDRLDS
jgi:hypothetical protein